MENEMHGKGNAWEKGMHAKGNTWKKGMHTKGTHVKAGKEPTFDAVDYASEWPNIMRWNCSVPFTRQCLSLANAS